jgi:hypothetical protein
MSLSGFEPAAISRPPAMCGIRARVCACFSCSERFPAAAIALLAPKASRCPPRAWSRSCLPQRLRFYAYRARVNYRSQGLTFWDLAGMLAFIGFGAGAMSEPLAALELFGMAATR